MSYTQCHFSKNFRAPISSICFSWCCCLLFWREWEWFPPPPLRFSEMNTWVMGRGPTHMCCYHSNPAFCQCNPRFFCWLAYSIMTSIFFFMSAASWFFESLGRGAQIGQLWNWAPQWARIWKKWNLGKLQHWFLKNN